MACYSSNTTSGCEVLCYHLSDDVSTGDKSPGLTTPEGTDDINTTKTLKGIITEGNIDDTNGWRYLFTGLFFYVYTKSSNPKNPEGPTPQAPNLILSSKPQPLNPTPKPP